MNWAMLALGVGAAAAVLVAIAARRGDGDRAGLVVAAALVVVVCLNGAAPIRALVDPDYEGFRFGLLAAPIGWPVTIRAGSVLLLSLASALIAVSRRRGPALWLVAATCLSLTVILGAPWAADMVRDPSANIIQLGEYLTIPGVAATALMLGVLVGPLAFGAVWAARRAGGRARTV